MYAKLDTKMDHSKEVSSFGSTKSLFFVSGMQMAAQVHVMATQGDRWCFPFLTTVIFRIIKSASWATGNSPRNIFLISIDIELNDEIRCGQLKKSIRFDSSTKISQINIIH